MSGENTELPSMETWGEKLVAVLGAITGTPPEVQEAGFGAEDKKTAAKADMVWWRSSATPGAFIGVSEADATTLLNMRTEAVPPEVADPLGANFGEIAEKSWGEGKLISRGPAAFADGQARLILFESGSIRFLMIPAGGDAPRQSEKPANSFAGDIAQMAGAVQNHPTQSPAAGRNLDLLLDIELPITLRFGTTHMPLREITGLSAGSVIEFDRGVDEPVEVLVNGHVVARGEAVIVQGAYGVRISEIASRRERLATSGVNLA